VLFPFVRNLDLKENESPNSQFLLQLQLPVITWVLGRRHHGGGLAAYRYVRRVLGRWSTTKLGLGLPWRTGMEDAGLSL